jgi:hypothetical protein
MDIEELLDLLEDWVASKPSARGHSIYKAELRLRSDGSGRLAVALNIKNVAAEIKALSEHLAELLRWSDAKAKGEEVGEQPSPTVEFHYRAFAEFASLVELEQLLLGEKEAEFYFDDEVKLDDDPLKP